jgi:hypothetical protein
MPEQQLRTSRAVAATHPQACGSAAMPIWGIVVAAMAAGTGLASVAVLAGGGVLAALLSYSLGGSLFVAACVAGLLARQAVPARRPRAAWRRGAGGQLRRLAS